jgi:CMP-N,N'-diacetyllegionaminic acid synthase
MNLVNVALIPARSGSKRLPNKNMKDLRNKPLIAYSIEQAVESRLFSEIIVSTDSEDIAKIARKFGASVPILRPEIFAHDSSPDIEWVSHALDNMSAFAKDKIEFMAILRPTSPLRSSGTIIKAFNLLQQNPWADSLRAMEVSNKHPGKMWILDQNLSATPFLNQEKSEAPTYNKPTQSLGNVWIQNASLEWARVKRVIETKSISGDSILGFEMPGLEGFDINTQGDWDYLDFLLSKNPKLLN